MHKEKRALKKIATIKIEPYLAEYVIGKRSGKYPLQYRFVSLYLGEYVPTACQSIRT